MKFPFTFVCKGDSRCINTAVSESEGNVKITWDNDGLRGCNGIVYKQEGVEEYIKRGVWIVTSVGEQTPPEAPVNQSNTVSTLTVQLSIEGAQAALEALTKLLEETNVQAKLLRKTVKKLKKEIAYVF